MISDDFLEKILCLSYSLEKVGADYRPLFLLVIWMWICNQVVLMHSTGHPVLRRSTEVNWGQMRSMTFADFFRVLLPFKVIWGADFDSDIHFGLRRLETKSWNHRFIQGQWRHMTRKWFFEFALAPSEAKLSAITGFRHFSALDLTSEVTGWPKTFSLYINLFVSRLATRSFFPRSSSSIRGETARGVVPTPPPLPVPWKDAKWPVPARVNLRSNFTYLPFKITRWHLYDSTRIGERNTTV